jgi:penicillin-binding protein 1A
MEQDEFQQWMALPLDLSYRKIDQNTGIAPYYRDHLEQSLLAILKDHHSDTINLYTDGLRIVTSIHSGVQEKAEHALEQHMKQLQMEFLEHWAGRDPWEGNPEFFLEQVRQSPSYKRMESSGMPAKAILETMKDDTAVFPDENGILKKVSPLDSVRMGLLTLHSGFLAIDPSNGQILAWIGGIDHRYYQFDHVTSKRQVGSIFKPFVYAAALQNGMKPCDFISNEQRLYEMYDGWSPSNADGKHDGYYSLKGGLTHSINTVTAELVVRIGPETVVELARKTGIRSDLPVVPSIALGSAELSLLEVISAYTCFIRDGTPIEPWSLLRIEDREGRILYRHSVDTESEPALDQETSLMMVEMLKNVVDSGTARSARTVFDIEAELAGKTGTTQDQGDGWFIGFTPGLLAGAWVGASFPSIHFRTTDLGQGAHTALPIVARFYRLMEQDEKYRTYTSGSFAPLPDELAAALDCPDYSLEDPEMNFFERLFRRDADRDSIRFQQREERRTEREEYKNQLEEEGVTGIKKAIKLLFGKRKNAEHTDSTNQK